MVAQLSAGPSPVKDLAESHPVSLPTFLKHLQVLEQAQIVSSAKRGRVRVCQLEPQRLIEAEHWLDRRRSEWTARLNQLDQLLIEMKQDDSP